MKAWSIAVFMLLFSASLAAYYNIFGLASGQYPEIVDITLGEIGNPQGSTLPGIWQLMAGLLLPFKIMYLVVRPIVDLGGWLQDTILINGQPIINDPLRYVITVAADLAYIWAVIQFLSGRSGKVME